MKVGIQLKELSKLGLTSDVSRSLTVNIIAKYCKHESKQAIINTITQILQEPRDWYNDPAWGKLAKHLCPVKESVQFKTFDLRDDAGMAACKVYGGKYINTNARQQMNTALKLPVTVQGALMPDAHGGYGMPIGGVLATDNVVIPYAVGVDIGCRMALTIFDENEKYLKRNTHQIKEAIKEWTHFGTEGGLEHKQEHAVLDNETFRLIPLLRELKGKAARQLGSSGSGNHFVEFGSIELYENNTLNLAPGKYTALLSHSGSRGLGAAIAMYYSRIAREICKLPQEAQQLAWLHMDSAEGQEYWLSMTLAGDYARACHERIHANLAKALGLQAVASVSNHHNFAWQEILDGQQVIVHRKGATPAHEGEMGIIPGSMTAAGYLVCGKGDSQAINSASHGAGRAMSRSKAKETFTNSSMKKMLQQADVTLIGGSTEEFPQAYKNIDEVMQAQTSLVDVHGKFMPCVVRMNKE